MNGGKNPLVREANRMKLKVQSNEKSEKDDVTTSLKQSQSKV